MDSVRQVKLKAVVLTAMLLNVCFTTLACAKSVTFTILSFNDVYEIAPDHDGRGGFASMQTLLTQERATSTHHVTTVNGDFLSPSILSIFDKGAHRIDLFNLLGIDMVVAGNHEFDFGPDEVTKRISESKFPWLTANAFGVDGRYFTGEQQTMIVDVDGIKIGFFGLITVETPELSSTEKKVCFSPLAFTARRMIQELKAQGADVIVALTHLLFAEDQQLAKEVPEIDVILGGHDHDPITWYDEKTFIHKSGQNAYYLARIDLTIEKEEGASKVRVFPSWKLLINKGLEEDSAVAKVVTEYQSMLNRLTSETLAVTNVEINTSYTVVRTEESVMGNLVADAIRLACDADVAIISGGIIRGNKKYKPGTTISMRDLYTEMPFGNLNVVVEIPGSAIWEALENGVSQYSGKAGRFPQVSGLSFIFDEALPIGSRILSVMIHGAPLDKEKLYKVATVDYMFNGGDGYHMFKNGHLLLSPLRQMSTVGTLAELLRSTRNIDARIEGRIVSISSSASLDEAVGLPPSAL